MTAKRLEGIDAQYSILPLAITPEEVLTRELDALILDVVPLGLRRWEWLQRVRQLSEDLGIVVCSAPTTVSERVRALRLGVDDWLAKPCHPEELIARVEGIVCARTPSQPRHELPSLIAGELEIRRAQRQVFVAGRSLCFTAREFQLVELLASYEGCILEREFIYQRVWGYDMNRGDRSVDVFVRKVRQKLERASPEWSYVHTHFRVGYGFAAQREGGAELPMPIAA